MFYTLKYERIPTAPYIKLIKHQICFLAFWGGILKIFHRLCLTFFLKSISNYVFVKYFKKHLLELLLSENIASDLLLLEDRSVALPLCLRPLERLVFHFLLLTISVVVFRILRVKISEKMKH
jgi:hypothetical protein